MHRAIVEGLASPAVDIAGKKVSVVSDSFIILCRRCSHDSLVINISPKLYILITSNFADFCI